MHKLTAHPYLILASSLGLPGGIDCIDYVTGIGNTHSIYWHSVFRLRAHLQSFLAQPPPTLNPTPLSLGTSAVLCNVLTPSREVWRAKSTLFHPVAKVGNRECQCCTYAASNPVELCTVALSTVAHSACGKPQWNFSSQLLMQSDTNYN